MGRGAVNGGLRMQGEEEHQETEQHGHHCPQHLASFCPRIQKRHQLIIYTQCKLVREHGATAAELIVGGPTLRLG